MSARTTQPYAVMLDVAGKLVVVVGGGPAAQRAARSLASHKANVVVIAPDMPIELRQAEADGLMTVEPRDFAPADLKGAFLVVAASGSAETDFIVAGAARERGILVNVASDAGASDYIVPSVVKRGALQIAVSTDGVAPAVARRVRRDLARRYGPEWGVYVALMGAVRLRMIETRGIGDAELAPLFDAIGESDVLARIRSGEDPTVDEIIEEFAAALPDTAASPEAAEADSG
jgi:precorrin-2 dehydrogenase/sirohydrochlorin ferrochelatase